VSAEHARVVTTDMLTSDDRAVRTRRGACSWIRKRSATRDLTRGSPGRERTRREAPELLGAAKA
jgi:hypothetical protein